MPPCTRRPRPCPSTCCPTPAPITRSGWTRSASPAAASEDEPIYGATYLPRKFKIGFAIPPYNDVDVFAQDLGFIAIIERRRASRGYNVTVGGGMGATHGDPETYPRLADVIGFVTPDQVTAVAEAVVTTQRDFGNRVVRKRARLKYTIDDRGLDWFKAEVERRAGFPLSPARPFDFVHNGDRFGWIAGDDGLALAAAPDPAHRRRTHLGPRRQERPHRPARDRQACSMASGEGAEFRLTPNQNLVIASVPAGLRERIDALVARYGLDGHGTASPLHRNALPASHLPTCGLAMAEAERYLPDWSARSSRCSTTHGIARCADPPAHQRLPERLLASLPRRDRSRRQGARPLQPDARRRPSRPAAQHAASRKHRRAGDPGRARSAVRPLCHRTRGRRRVRRLPGAQRHRHAASDHPPATAYRERA